MLSKPERQKILELGCSYDVARKMADKFAHKKKDIGDSLVKALVDAGKKKIAGLLDGEDGIEDGRRVLVGVAERKRYTFDQELMFARLNKYGLFDRVAKVVIDEDRLAELLGSEDVDPAVLQKIAELVKTTRTTYPIVRVGSAP